MCGIVYIKRKDDLPARKSTWKRYQAQKSRGQEGFGFIGMTNGKIDDIFRTEDEESIEELLKESASDEILFHHRMPTSTPNLAEAAHPIKVEHSTFKHDYYVVHNGIISNPDGLKEKHEKKGFVYTTVIHKKTTWKTYEMNYYDKVDFFNDSEAFAIELALVLEGKKKTIDAKGSIAFMCIETTKGGKVRKLHYGRNWGNPLKIHRNKQLVSICSTGNGVTLDADKIYTVDYKTGKISELKIDIGDYSYHGSSMGYGRHGYDMYGSYDSTIQHSLTGKTIDTIEKRKQYDPFDMDDPLVIAERRGELHLEIEEAEEELKQAQKERFNAAYGTEEWIYLDQYVTTIEADLKELKHEYDNLV